MQQLMWKKGNRININDLKNKNHLLIKFECGLCGVENEIMFFDYSNTFFLEYPYYVWENEFGCPHCEKSNYHKIDISIDDDLIINIESDFNEFEKNINKSLYYSTEIKDKNKYTIEFPLELEIIEQYLNENHYLVFGKSMIGILDILNSKSISENEIIKNLIYSNLITIFETYISDFLISKVDSNKDLQIKVVEDYNIFSGIKIDKKNIYNVMNDLKSEILVELNKIVYHNLNKVIPLYKKVLNIDFSDRLNLLPKAIKIRHDLIHRNGKNKNGEYHKITDAMLKSLIVEIKDIAEYINRETKN
ncbi:hypothetical protein SAMN05428642_11010 [Flaviramulus basaltis]|uniref:Uncharacterized protein n=1 Tax=Flaviramulus basaltis TaxID=369401 RepID=A0A1K2IS34_9FLAO|nr:hypothetical protein [Flaviramulus basaltis]SFZ95183.1 hypothetical protein SAMN05428642_11010 [Flaviramulus basaltis]